VDGMWSMKALFLIPVLLICGMIEAIRLLKNKVYKKDISEYRVEGKWFKRAMVIIK
jgi:hypothetical protein